MPAESNREQIIYGAEPLADTPVMTVKEVTSESLMADKRTERSQRVRADRMVPEWLRLSIGARGGLMDELGAKSLQPFAEAALANNAKTPITSEVAAVVVTAQTAPYNGGKLTKTGQDWNTAMGGNLDSGQFVNLSGLSEAGDNGVLLVTQVTENALTVVKADGTALTAEASADLTISKSKAIINGTVNKSMTFEKEQTDITNSFQRFTGMEVNSWTVEMTAGEIVKSNYDYLGLAGTANTSSLDSDPAAAPAEAPVTASANLEDVKIDYAEAGNAYKFIQNLTLEVQNNLRAPAVVGQLAAGFVNAGSIEIRGRLGVFYNDLDSVEAFVNHTAFSISALFKDPAGNFIGFNIPKVYFTAEGTPVSGGLNQDIQVNHQIGAALVPKNDTDHPNSRTITLSLIDA